ncbi:Putative uncharacterized protein XF1677 [Moritella viscosa]|nr:Putative uncharacterized protein XF1677 [Moritella viscosa]SHO21439.1 Putative uncharacterized protein XF1677 [Moritella viscosa]
MGIGLFYCGGFMKLEFNNIFDAITDNKSEASRLKTRSNLMISSNAC